jgi:hypothetical protein
MLGPLLNNGLERAGVPGILPGEEDPSPVGFGGDGRRTGQGPVPLDHRGSPGGGP